MLLALFAVIAALGVVFYFQKQGITTFSNSNQLVIKLNPTDPDSGIFGSTATLTEVDGKTIVTLDLKNTPAGSNEPAHIHVGSCPTPGDVKYPLTNAVDGKSETTLAVTLDQLIAAKPLAINVHKSPQEVAIYLYCGNL